ncbi:restriction endonuclease [Paenibacillus flagellatus]|uniref:Restriction endonuclease n=2 Tax=Paenibacillus flagellatus TaxID=2211139 RepID=A0A2V5KE78_9BACL|nr:restriction endonuclease [Paenibacillus flagellatus]
MVSFNVWGKKVIILPFLIIGVLLSVKIIPEYIKRQKMKKANIEAIDKMEGFEFEEYLTYIFQLKGYKSERTKASGDFGADIVLQKDGIKTVVQTKRYKNKVDLSAVQEIVTSMRMYQANFAMVVTNSYFTKPAIELAKANNVELWDRDRLINELARMRPSKNE